MNEDSSTTQNFSKILGNAILLASIQASIGSVEMSSKFSVINFSKDPETLQAASDALTGYIIIAIIWMFGAVLISYGQYGLMGLVTSFIANMIMILWILLSYAAAFNTASKRHGVKFPKLFKL
jgi:hypothetical protein